MGSANSTKTVSNGHQLDPSPSERGSERPVTDYREKREEKETSKKLRLTRLTLPVHISHIKTGNTLATNGEFLILQDGATTMDLRTPPEFKSTKMPWKFGLIRDIIWSDSLQRFVLLTKNMIYTFDPTAFSQQVFSKAPTNDVTIETYAQIQPVHPSYAFWRCATFDDTLLIIYAGFGTVMDQYKITRKSSQLIKRWQPPATCAPYEGIWCIRHHPETKQIGCALLDARTNHWRLEVRDRERFTCLWRINLPFENGDCEVSPLLNGQWLTTNSFNVRLIQVAQERLESAVEYERELKNALLLNDDFLVVRTKSTIEIHRLDQMK